MGANASVDDPDMENLIIDSVGRPGSSFRRRRTHPNGGQASQALGRSRGGFTTKVHPSVDGLGNPLRYRLTGGQEHDVTQAAELISGIESEHVIADRAYDSNQFLGSIIRSGAVPVIPPRSNRREPHSYDEYLYRERPRRVFHRQDQALPSHLGSTSWRTDTSDSCIL